MVKKVISYYNKELKFYESLKVVENQSNEDITGSCKRYLGMCPRQEAAACFGKSIFIIGEFDDESVIEPLSSYKEPVLVVDCDAILKVRFPEMYKDGIERIETGETA